MRRRLWAGFQILGGLPSTRRSFEAGQHPGRKIGPGLAVTMTGQSPYNSEAPVTRSARHFPGISRFEAGPTHKNIPLHQLKGRRPASEPLPDAGLELFASGPNGQGQLIIPEDGGIG